MVMGYHPFPIYEGLRICPAERILWNVRLSKVPREFRNTMKIQNLRGICRGKSEADHGWANFDLGNNPCRQRQAALRSMGSPPPFVGGCQVQGIPAREEISRGDFWSSAGRDPRGAVQALVGISPYGGASSGKGGASNCGGTGLPAGPVLGVATEDGPGRSASRPPVGSR